MHEAYAAGFMDGDGCISIRCSKGGKICGVYVIFVQTERAPLDALCERYGGSIAPCDSNTGLHNWRWVIASANAKRFLIDTLPHLIQKKKQAELALLLQSQLECARERVRQLGCRATLTEEDLAFRVKIWKEVKSLNTCHKRRLAPAETKPNGSVECGDAIVRTRSEEKDERVQK